MLLAQFIGIVLETVLWALGGRAQHGFTKFCNFDLALVSGGSLSANVERLLSLMPSRNFNIHIIPTLKNVERWHIRTNGDKSILSRDHKNIVKEL
ncbi:MAG: hypothetical protein QXU18_07615 [Thermoplasmatales archaeon]